MVTYFMSSWRVICQHKTTRPCKYYRNIRGGGVHRRFRVYQEEGFSSTNNTDKQSQMDSNENWNKRKKYALAPALSDNLLTDKLIIHVFSFSFCQNSTNMPKCKNKRSRKFWYKLFDIFCAESLSVLTFVFKLPWWNKAGFKEFVVSIVSLWLYETGYFFWTFNMIWSEQYLSVFCSFHYDSR